MIKKLKRKFIVLSMTSLFVLLAVIVAGMNIINYNDIVNESDEILSLLSQNKGVFPDPIFPGELGHRLPQHMSPELPYESRYFSVLLEKDGNVVHTETSRIVSVDEASAMEYAKEVISSKKTRGFTDSFRFISKEEGELVRITFLDCGRRLDAFWGFFIASSGMALAGFVIVFFIIAFFSGRIIRPIAQSYEKQKRFITDAGHEIKTPLTIISANADVLEMDIGENECLADIKAQTEHLGSLVGDLVFLSRMEESEISPQMIEFPLSEVVEGSAAPFKTLAYSKGKELVCDIKPMLSLVGDAKSIGRLTSILLDNAVKYAPADTKIFLELARTPKGISLSVSNTLTGEIGREELGRLFDRFYRTDPSRNSETGGYGIGLSIARAIVNAHGGKINASSQKPDNFTVTAHFPT